MVFYLFTATSALRPLECGALTIHRLEGEKGGHNQN